MIPFLLLSFFFYKIISLTCKSDHIISLPKNFRLFHNCPLSDVCDLTLHVCLTCTYFSGFISFQSLSSELQCSSFLFISLVHGPHDFCWCHFFHQVHPFKFLSSQPLSLSLGINTSRKPLLTLDCAN